ncbi:DUF305 domain-containing protein [Polymorphospora sp. NPDC050346]|uniref:DUF305 domain-containing protein n=1 Tax=Polymorphospora sp. NPDC050346 TaxID=3155780 RepID=UPI0033FE340E
MHRSTTPPVVAVACLAALLAGGCATTNGGAPGTDPGPPAAATPSTSFNGTDLAWVQLMIPMNERTLPLLELAVARGTDPDLRRLAGEIHAAHLAELTRLRHLRTLAGLDGTNPHEGHDMPGMVTAVQLDALRAATGTEFDRLFHDRLREHVDQSARVSRGEQESGADAATVALAGEMTQVRTTYLTRLDQLTAL